jgi:hypothetical protein
LFFDPAGSNAVSFKFDPKVVVASNLSQEEVESQQKYRATGMHDYIEIFISLLLALCNRRAAGLRALVKKLQYPDEVLDSIDLDDSGLSSALDQPSDATPKLLVERLDSRRVSAISCGCNHSIAMIENGDLYCWGR